MIDDARVARDFVAARSGKRALGDHRLRQELVKRGLPEESLDGASSEAERIEDLLRSKFTPEGNRAKAARFLYSRGFAEDAIESALERFFGAEDFGE